MHRGRQVREVLRTAVIGIYILQVPLFLGLMIALVVFAASFFFAIFEAVWTLGFLNRREAILLVLDLLDMVFIANLIVMVMVSGYNAFNSSSILRQGAERRRRAARAEGAEVAAAGDESAVAPDADETDEGLNQRDEFSPIKSKIAATLVVISGIHILHEVLAEERADANDLLVLGGFHILLLLTAAVFVAMSRFER